MEDPDTVYCYLVRKNTHTWYLARNDCINSHSDLLSITNAKEQEFVTKHLLAESFMWIGYNDLEREGKWAWSDRYCALLYCYSHKKPSQTVCLGSLCHSLSEHDDRFT